MTPADFEALYRADPDPWRFATDAYEQGRYRATVQACRRADGARAMRGLELGAANGVLSELLAPLCRRLETLECAPSAVRAARSRLARCPGGTEVVAHLGRVPEDLPEGPFDLIVASEVLYYLDETELATTIEALTARLVPAGRLVAVHWTGVAPRHVRSGPTVHAALRAAPGLRSRHRGGAPGYVLDVLEAR